MIFKIFEKNYSRADICAQPTRFKKWFKCIKNLSKKKFNIALAGGVFANVK